MGEKLKFIAAAAAAAIAIAALSILAAIWYSRGADGLLTYMPEPSGDAPYVLIEAKEGRVSCVSFVADYGGRLRALKERHVARRGGTAMLGLSLCSRSA